MDVCAVIMAAGAGKRMNSVHAKVVHPAAGKPLVCWVKDTLLAAGATDQACIVGHRQEEVREVLGEDVAYILQDKQLGTGHAVMQASHFLEGRNGCTIVLSGDAPLVTAETLQKALNQFQQSKSAVVLITAKAPDPSGYGRIIRDHQGAVQAIVEHRDATPQQLAIDEVNAGMYCFDTALLLSALGKIGSKNNQNEYYLTDTISVLISEGHQVEACFAPYEETLGVNNRVQLQQASSILNNRILEQHMMDGVTIIDPSSTWIEPGVQIGSDSVIWQNCRLAGKTVIGDECEIGPDSHLDSTIVGNSCKLDHVTARQCSIGDNCEIGPYVQIRYNSEIGEGCKIGNFVEIKNSTIGAGTLIAHQCYIGDTDVGKNVNFGSGCSIANYDGLVKSRTSIGSHAFIGSNCTLVAPVSVEENAYVAAGSTITDDVQPFALAIARSHQQVKADWVKTRGRLRGRRVNP